MCTRGEVLRGRALARQSSGHALERQGRADAGERAVPPQESASKLWEMGAAPGVEPGSPTLYREVLWLLARRRFAPGAGIGVFSVGRRRFSQPLSVAASPF